MGSVAYRVATTAAVALTGGAAKTCLMVLTPAQFGACITHVTIGFDGVTASAVPALWQVVRSTNASNSTPGTNNTNENANIFQVRGRSITTGFTAFSASTTEPTVLTVMDQQLVDPGGWAGGVRLPVGSGDRV